MQKAADLADISVLFFGAGANFWAMYALTSAISTSAIITSAIIIRRISTRAFITSAIYFCMMLLGGNNQMFRLSTFISMFLMVLLAIYAVLSGIRF